MQKNRVSNWIKIWLFVVLCLSFTSAEEVQASFIQPITKINVNTEYDVIDDAGGEMYYQFSLTKAGIVEFEITDAVSSELGNDGLYYIVMWDDEENMIIDNISPVGTETGKKFLKLGLAKGTYYIRIHGGQDSYSFSINYNPANMWECENNSTLNTANAIQFDKTYHGSMHEVDDTDYYKISMKKAGYITVELKHNIDLKGELFTLGVLDASGTQCYSHWIKGQDKSTTTCKIPIGKGTYYINVEGNTQEYHNGEYQLKVSAKAASGWEKECNDYTSKAQKISVGKPVKGITQGWMDWQDYYKVVLKKATYITVSLEHRYIKGNNNMYIVDLIAEDWGLERFVVSKLKDTYAQSKAWKLPAGTYYIKINPQFEENGDTMVAEGEEYKLTVQQVKKKAPTIKNITTTGNKKMTITWKPVPGVLKYEIYRATSKNGKYSKVKTISDASTTSWTDSKVKIGTTYFYKMKSIVLLDVDGTSGFSKVKSAKCTPAAPTLSSVGSSASKSITIKWKKASGVTGYEVYRATSENGKYTKVKTIKKAGTTTFKNTKLKSGKTYYYKIRAYKVVKGKKVYSSYSKIKSVKAM